MIGILEEQKRATQMVLILSPTMTFFISISTPGALTLCFLVSSLIAILQQATTTFTTISKIKKDVTAELGERLPKVVVTQGTIDGILNTTTSSDINSETERDLHRGLHARNAGKQRRPHNSDKD